MVEGLSDLNVAPLAVVGCHWSFFLFGMVLGHMGEHVGVGVGELQVSPCSLVDSSGSSGKPAKLVGNCGESARLSRFGMLNLTSFCAGLWGEHYTVNSGGEWGHHAVHVSDSQLGQANSSLWGLWLLLRAAGRAM